MIYQPREHSSFAPHVCNSMQANYPFDSFSGVQVVFRDGEGALQVLPALIDVITEARLNLVIYYLRQGGPPLLSLTSQSNDN